MNVAPQEVHQLLAWRVEFTDRASTRDAKLIRQPRTAWMQFHDLDPRQTLLDDAGPDRTSDGLTFVFLAAGAATPYEIQKRAEAWMTRRAGEEDESLQVQLRSERLLWRRGRAVCFGAAHAAQEMLAGVGLFAFCEGELTRLERQVQDSWATLESDTVLLNSLSRSALKRQSHIDATARAVTAMRVAYVRLQTALEKPQGDLGAPARRLFLELALQADTLDRLRSLDDAIEVFEEFYRHVREQFSEFRYFTAEYRVEVLILLALLGDLLIAMATSRSLLSSMAHWAGAGLTFLR